MMRSYLPLGTFSALLLTTCCVGEPLVHFRATNVSYRGITSNGVEHFRNIRYGLDTSGDRRFAPPEPYNPKAGTVVDASERGAACPQPSDALPPFFSSEPNVSEDCLSLQISRPAGLDVTSKSKLPVLVWIHGGGVVKGSAYDEHSDPERLINLSFENGQPVLYAAINYRIGVFGFARTDTLMQGTSLNAGMRDQRAALEWIRDHVAAFGGDPERVTVFGLSAGGTFISLQHLAYGGERGVPFQQAFMMSGSTGTALNATTDATKIHTVNVANEVGCENSDDRAMTACLREVPMEKLLDTAVKYSVANHPPSGLFTFIPTADGDIYPDRASKLLHEGKFVKGISSILAWTEDDGAMNVGPGHLIQTEQDMLGPLEAFAASLSPEQISKLFSLYPSEDFADDVHNYQARKPPDAPSMTPHYFRISRLLRDMLFTCASFDFTYQMVRHTRATVDSSFSNVRHYTLNQSMLTPLWAGAGMPYVQVSHGSDQNYVFNGVFPESPIGESDQQLSKQLSSSIISFAATGNPVSSSAPSYTFDEWPEAYSVVASEDQDVSLPEHLNLLVVGGPYGSRPVKLAASENEEGLLGSVAARLGEVQQPLSENFGFGAMGSEETTQLTEKIAAQKLFGRCAYINSLGETLGN